ncbi:hypothetical protein SAMN00808754_1587 [Thermanaeromonas toyohensis ToBE]|uniref:Uncharacterized protein n=1 Tax=Thermanaeromonas toyohensis ToBE TaxID=698762 RepID=A0A1W1VTN0_9FIRM|nr:hypothetical protein [Thermanaeromonas toyohensis]SMB96686.1 hypothetical protein SAMN00808754_1587 [Thermanaeromonas toyohensis ToBE]
MTMANGGKHGKRRGNRQLQVRLPADHWVWTLDSATRSQEVKKALEFYRNYRELLESIRADLEHIKSLLASGVARVQAEGVQNEGMQREDARLMNTLEKFLDF